MAKSLLLVTQFAPPSTLVAARRTAGLTKYLARLGYRVTVLTSLASGAGEELEGATRVVRTTDAIATPLNWRRRHFEALGGATPATYSRPSRLQSVVVPDLALVGWVPFALLRALSLARREPFDCVLTSSPPPSVHLVGLALKRRGVPWIAEFRDGWTFEPPQAPFPLATQRAVDRRLERRVVERADAVVAVTKPIVDDLRDRFGVPAELVTNGFDPEETAPEENDALLDPARHSLVHTGRMGSAGATPEPLLGALRLLRPDEAARLEIVFAGPLSEREQELFSAPDLAGVVQTVGSLDRTRTLRLQRAADSLLVVTEGASRRSVATGKLFEYLAAKKPILVLGDETEAARIVNETGAGFATSAIDPVQIAAALRRLLTSPPGLAAAESLEPYAHPAIAARLAQVIEQVSLG
jgi:glycosyltransferase involved in cell wall biosynthesis